MDLGAESGRVMLGTLDNGKVALEEIHRFPNSPIRVNSTLRWDVLRIYDELKKGAALVTKRGITVAGLSADSWGVDYVLLRKNEPMLTAPFNYRDSRTDGGFDRAFAVVPRETIFKETGIQFMTLNTLFQMHAHVTEDAALLKAADHFLCMGDYINYLFSGVVKAEESLASTTQLYNPRKKEWAWKIINKFKIPKHVFPEVIPSGSVLGEVLPSIADELGLRGAKVIATCSHDTGAAVAAIPGEGNDWAYLSSGTWSLMGVELQKPLVKPECLEANFTNEQGLGGTTRFLKNIVGLWLIQECRRQWAKEGTEYDYATLTQLAAAAPAFGPLINPNDESFNKPDSMPSKIQDFCRHTGQGIPQSHGEILRCAMESLALFYRVTLEKMQQLTKRKIKRLHVVGGGSKNELLVQFTANALQLPVLAGPVEATAIGNILIQALALGDIKSHEELRSIVKNSFEVKVFQPEEKDQWTAALERFRHIVR